MAGQVVGKVAVVTGGSSGTRRASAFAFAREGAQVKVSMPVDDILYCEVEGRGNTLEKLYQFAFQIGHSCSYDSPSVLSLSKYERAMAQLNGDLIADAVPIPRRPRISALRRKIAQRVQPEKGKPLERVGRKATGLRPEYAGYGRRAARGRSTSCGLCSPHHTREVCRHASKRTIFVDRGFCFFPHQLFPVEPTPSCAGVVRMFEASPRTHNGHTKRRGSGAADNPLPLSLPGRPEVGRCF
jgi:hypothetical protein